REREAHVGEPSREADRAAHAERVDAAPEMLPQRAVTHDHDLGGPAVGTRQDLARRVEEMLVPLARFEPADGPDHRPSGIESARPGGAPAKRSTSTPLGITAHRAGTPWRSLSARKASALTTTVSTRRPMTRQARRARVSSPVRLRLLASTTGTRARRPTIVATR